MVNIIMNNVYSTFEGMPLQLKTQIDNMLSYEIGGFGVKKEKVYLFDFNNNVTFTGLVPYVISILKRNNISYKLNDNRIKPESNANFKVQDMFEARDYQQNIVDRASSREVLQAATGAGKTFIMAKLIEKFNVKPIVVIAPKVSLALQIKEEFERFLNVEVGVMGGGYNSIKDITVGTPQSLSNEIISSGKLVMCDECLKYDQKVLMGDGKTYKKIGDLVKEKSNELVMSYNHITGRLEPKSIISHSETPLSKNNKRLMKLTIRKPNDTKEIIECTDNHKIWVENLNKYIMAKNLLNTHIVRVLVNGILYNGIIEKIEILNQENINVYDIGVKDNHNFICENILVHNCHNIPANTIQSVFKRATNAYYRIGVSATPWRDSGDDILIEAVLNVRRPELSLNASKLIQKGKLVPCTINMLEFDNSNIKWQGSYNKTYMKAISHNVDRNEIINKLAIKEVNNGRTPIILINKIEHGNLLLASLKRRLGYNQKTITINDKEYQVGNVEFVSGEDDINRRQAVFKSVKEGFTKILIGSTIADEGLDLPRLDCLILAGSGKCSTRAFQRIGRVLRLHQNKVDAIVYDFVDLNYTFYNHSMIRKALYETEPEWKINMIKGDNNVRLCI